MSRRRQAVNGRKAFTSPGSIRADVAAAAVAVRPHSVVRAQVPVLRFQLARMRKGERSRSSDTSTRCAPISKPRCRSIWGRKVHTMFLRRRHAEPVVGGKALDRLLSRCARAAAARRRRRDHARSQPRHVREREVRAVSRERRQPAVGRHPELQRAASEGARPHPRRREARRAIEIAARHFRQLQSRPDVSRCRSRRSTKRWRDIETALAFAPPHLSLYHLTLEPNTLFAKFPPRVPDDDASADMQDMIHERTRAAGYAHYESRRTRSRHRQAGTT